MSEASAATAAIIGLGYVGLPLAEAASRHSRVIGFDIDPNVTTGLNAGVSHVEDIPDAQVSRMLGDGFVATSQPQDLHDADVYVICVPTPLSPTGGPDLEAVKSAGSVVTKGLRPGNLVILESTTYPGTTDTVLRPILESSGLTAGEDFNLAFSPERIDPGNQHYTLGNTPKIVGGLTAACRDAAFRFYEPFVGSVVLAEGLREAEMAKLLENTYRHVNIALVNELARLGRSLDIDVQDAIRCASTKPFGFEAFYPGPGVGGHCIPVDPTYLSHHVRAKLGRPFRLIELAQEINLSMPTYVVERLRDELDIRGRALSTCRVLLVGISYKSDVADLRETPASDVVRNLRSFGAVIEILDPLIDGWEVDGEPLKQVDVSAALDYDATVVLQHHSAVTPEIVLGSSNLVLDTRAKIRGPHVTYL